MTIENSYSAASAKRLAECDPRLQSIFRSVLKVMDHTIITGHRPKAEQDRMVALGRSKATWPASKHNREPSMAVDAAPYPVDWSDRERMTLFAGLVIGVGAEQGVRIRWGGDWDQDGQVRDNTFDDLCHFEIDERE